MPRSCVKKFAIRKFRMSFFSCCSCCFSIQHAFTLSCMHTNSNIKTRTIPNRTRFHIAALSSLSFYVWSKLFTFFYTTTCWCNIYLNGKHGAMYKYRVHNKMHGKFKFSTRTNAIQCPHKFLFDLFKMQPFFWGAFIAWEQKKIIIYRIKCSYEKKASSTQTAANASSRTKTKCAVAAAAATTAWMMLFASRIAFSVYKYCVYMIEPAVYIYYFP